jgi:hypothetical protein
MPPNLKLGRKPVFLRAADVEMQETLEELHVFPPGRGAPARSVAEIVAQKKRHGGAHARSTFSPAAGAGMCFYNTR